MANSIFLKAEVEMPNDSSESTDDKVNYVKVFLRLMQDNHIRLINVFLRGGKSIFFEISSNMIDEANKLLLEIGFGKIIKGEEINYASTPDT